MDPASAGQRGDRSRRRHNYAPHLAPASALKAVVAAMTVNDMIAAAAYATSRAP